MHMNNGASAHFMGDSDISESSWLVGTSQSASSFIIAPAAATHADIQTRRYTIIKSMHDTNRGRSNAVDSEVAYSDSGCCSLPHSRSQCLLSEEGACDLHRPLGNGTTTRALTRWGWLARRAASDGPASGEVRDASSQAGGRSSEAKASDHETWGLSDGWLRSAPVVSVRTAAGRAMPVTHGYALYQSTRVGFKN
jgi:hypothetical protein